MKIGQVNTQQIRGLGDKVAGVTKEFVGVIVGNDSLQQAGERQQERATEELRALRKQIVAEGKEQKARAAETRQRAAQRARER